MELPPQFTKKIETKTVTAGEQEVIFETEITKGDAATKWLKNGAEIKPVESGPEGQKNKVKIDGKRQKLSICNVTTAGKLILQYIVLPEILNILEIQNMKNCILHFLFQFCRCWRIHLHNWKWEMLR